MSATPAGRTLHVAEPPAAWLHRAPVVADCSVLAAIVFDEPAGAEAARMLAGKALHAPTLLPYEMANVARSKQRGGLAEASVNAALADFAEQRLQLVAAPPEALLVLALRHALSAHDAAYLWLAGELQAPLATFDAKLAKAASLHLRDLQ
jgi:predicted nucleic acid-binding protein